MSETEILQHSLQGLFGWNKARLQCFTMIIMAMISARSVNLANIADHAKPTKKTKYESLYKRIQRFFAKYELPFDDIARFIFNLFSLSKCQLIIDRTNWWFGEKPINYLMLSVRYKNVALPLFWIALEKCGNSPAAERIRILKRFITCFGKTAIRDFCGDREFACIALLKYLVAETIPFTLRIKGDCSVKNSRGKRCQIKSLFRDLRPREIRIVQDMLVLKHVVDIVAYLRPNGELVILATNHDLDRVQDRYINRNQIETMFKAMKTQGFNLEDTHLTNPDRVGRLMGCLAISFAWSYKIGDYINEENPILVKSHGRRLRSIFKTGFKFLINLFSNLRQRFDEFMAIILLIFHGDKSQMKTINFNWL